MNQERGKFGVIYGPNNVGKTTQLGLLARELISHKKNFVYLKYPLSWLEPTGPVIDGAMRNGVKISEREFQQLCVKNRRDFEPQLRNILDMGLWVMTEDYKGTGIAWGVVNGIPLEEMERMNAGLRDEDLAIMLDAEERFHGGIEQGHRHEENGNWYKARDVHRMLAGVYGWQVVDAAGTPEEVHKRVWKVVEPMVNKNKSSG